MKNMATFNIDLPWTLRRRKKINIGSKFMETILAKLGG
jgi:hypothetical protein